MLFALLTLSGGFVGCRSGQRVDTVLNSAANSSRTFRATVLLRQYYVDGHLDNSPTTYVLLDKDTGKPDYENGMDFKESQIVMQPSQVGTLTVQWIDDQSLKITCVQCGLALSAVGPHADGVGRIRVVYEGFPETSSWEGTAHSH